MDVSLLEADGDEQLGQRTSLIIYHRNHQGSVLQLTLREDGDAAGAQHGSVKLVSCWAVQKYLYDLRGRR